MICRHCRAEVRFGFRRGEAGWWHKEDVDHESDPVVEPAVEPPMEIPEPEVRRTPLEVDDERVRGGIKTLVNLLVKQEWEIVRLSYARGPYLGAKEVLGISDHITLKARRGDRAIVACWRDGKFDTGYALSKAAGPRAVNSNVLKRWIKGEQLDDEGA